MQAARGHASPLVVYLLMAGCWLGLAVFLVGLATEPLRGVQR